MAMAHSRNAVGETLYWIDLDRLLGQHGDGQGL